MQLRGFLSWFGFLSAWHTVIHVRARTHPPSRTHAHHSHTCSLFDSQNSRRDQKMLSMLHTFSLYMIYSSFAIRAWNALSTVQGHRWRLRRWQDRRGKEGWALVISGRWLDSEDFWEMWTIAVIWEREEGGGGGVSELTDKRNPPENSTWLSEFYLERYRLQSDFQAGVAAPRNAHYTFYPETSTMNSAVLSHNKRLLCEGIKRGPVRSGVEYSCVSQTGTWTSSTQSYIRKLISQSTACLSLSLSLSRLPTKEAI